MKHIYFLSYKGKELPGLRQVLKENFPSFTVNEFSGNNIDVKEFVRIKLKALDKPIDYFILDVRALQSTEYTTILSFKANLLDKYPTLKAFLVVAENSDGLSTEEYNDIVRNSVNGKNYILFSDSSNQKNTDNIVAYIKESSYSKQREEPEGDTGCKASLEAVKAPDDIIRAPSKISDNERAKTICLRARRDSRIGGIAASDEKRKHTDKGEYLLNKESFCEILRDDYAEERSRGMYRIKREHSPESRFNVDNLFVAESGIKEASNEHIITTGDMFFSSKRIWSGYDNMAVFIGAERKVGTSFVAMSIAMALSKEGAVASYVQLSKLPDLELTAHDYGFVNKGDYYEYDKVLFVQNAFLDEVNYHILDLGDDYRALDKAIELGWLANKQLFIVSGGGTKELRRLNECISRLPLSLDFYKILIVNPILSKELYYDYEDSSRVYYFEHMKRINDIKNSYTLSLITEDLYGSMNMP